MGSDGAHCARVLPCTGVPAGLEGLGHAQGAQWGSKREAGPAFQMVTGSAGHWKWHAVKSAAGSRFVVG